MSKPIFKELVSPEEARELVRKNFNIERRIEKVSISEAYGRVLAEDIYSPIDLPPYTRSLRDGYAVKADDIARAREDEPIKLKVIGIVEAGGRFNGFVRSGEAVRVATGAHLPAGANTIVMEEYTKLVEDTVYIYKSSPPGNWIQYAGSDISKGDLVYRRGTILGPREIGVLAGIGFEDIPVYSRLKVGVISSGNEIVPPGHELKFGEIYDVNSYSISSLLLEDGCEPSILGIARDEYNSIYDLISRALENFDIVIFSGATSVGVKDLLFEVLNDFPGFKPLFYGVRMKPGKPTLAAVINGKLFIGLPGFPVSGLMVYLHIFSSHIRNLNGLPARENISIYASSGRRFESVFGVEHLYPVFLKRLGNSIVFYPIKTDSGAIATLSQSDGFIIIPNEIQFVDRGDKYEVHLFSIYNSVSDLIVYTSHSKTIDNILHEFSVDTGYNVKRIFSGSLGALMGVREGYNDFGTIHLISDSGEYNVPFIEKFDVKDAILFYGFWREIGFVVKKGNPYGIRGIEDLIDKDVKFINRPLGSGIRTYLDNSLREIADKRGVDFNTIVSQIEGYNVFGNTHSAVVSSVEQGIYDVGLVAREAVEGYDVDFIPLHWERVDYLFNRATFESTPVSKWMEYLSSEEVKSYLASIPGIKIDDKYFTKLV